MKHYYLELKEGDKVLKRKKTSLSSEYRDRELLNFYKSGNQEVVFIVSSTKEKIIN